MKKKILALNFKLLAQMTGDSITENHVLKVITSAMESHSDYSLREPRTSYTAISNWVARASCNIVSISWFTEPNMWRSGSGILAVPINKQKILSFISYLEIYSVLTLILLTWRIG